MNNPSPNIQLTFSMFSCRCIDFTMSQYAKNNTNIIPLDKYQFTFSLSLDINEEKKLIGVIIKSSVGEAFDQKETIATIDAINEFNIVNIEQILTDSKEGKLLPDQVLIQLFSISVSNLRGMYAAKLADSIYSNSCLPLVDVSTFIPKKPSPVG